MSLVHNFFAGQIKVVTVLTKLDNNIFYSKHKDDCVATLFVECPTSDPRGCYLVKPSPPSLKQKNEFLSHQQCWFFTNAELESQNGCGPTIWTVFRISAFIETNLFLQNMYGPLSLPPLLPLSLSLGSRLCILQIGYRRRGRRKVVEGPKLQKAKLI